MTNQAARSIRSYVRRSRRLSPSGTRAFADHWQRYGLPEERTLGAPTVFGREAPLVLEIGFGGGEQLFHMASERPQADFVGIEVWVQGVAALMRQMAQAELTNVRVAKTDAARYLSECIPADCLDEVWILFPDPWPKRSHQKRRLIKERFLRMLSEKVKSGGVVCMATDWANYGEEMLRLGEESEAFDVCEDAPDARLVATRFEKKGTAAGRRIFEITLRRKPR